MHIYSAAIESMLRLSPIACTALSGCVHAGTETQALEPCSLQLSRFSPYFLSLSLPLLRPQPCEILGFPSVVPGEAEKILPRKHVALLLSKGANGDRGVWFLPFACSRVRTTCKRGSFPHVCLLKIRFVQHDL